VHFVVLGLIQFKISQSLAGQSIPIFTLRISENDTNFNVEILIPPLLGNIPVFLTQINIQIMLIFQAS
jgi:hypothetical protein